MFADLLTARLELRFDERDDVPARFEERRQRRQDETERDERHVNRHHAHGMRHIVRREMTGVHAFAHGDPWIGAKWPGELTVTNVESDDTRRAAAEENIGEPAG